MNLVVDASLVVSALIDNGPDGQWAEEVLIGGNLCAPHLMPIEVANILRRAALAGDISQDSATLAHQALHSFRCELFDYELLAERVWALRANVTAYDACYIALAEILDAELATLDRALSRASGPSCRFLLPPDLVNDGD
jgi:predicted nucleic acid-binding protein